MIIDYLWCREISLNDEVIDLGHESCDYINKLVLKSGSEEAIGILVCGMFTTTKRLSNILEISIGGGDSRITDMVSTFIHKFNN
jgi:hypothetical protein